MNKKNQAPKKRMRELITLLDRWNYEYYILNRPSVEDAVYDKHLKELRELEIQHNLIFPNSPTQKAGHHASHKFHPVVRRRPMLSLDSVDNYEDLLKFDERVKKILKTEQEIEYICEWKIDGLSVSLIYQNHRLTQISTRGNGTIGEDITFNKELIKNIPFFLKEITDCEVRGEVYMEKEEFTRLNEELSQIGSKLLANPRNAAAGSLRTLIPLQGRNLHFFAYQLFANESLNNNLSRKKDLAKKLKLLRASSRKFRKKFLFSVFFLLFFYSFLMLLSFKLLSLSLLLISFFWIVCAAYLFFVYKQRINDYSRQIASFNEKEVKTSPTNQFECLEKLVKLGFAVSPDYRVFKNVEGVRKFIQKQAKNRAKLDFESDGVVVKVNDYNVYEKLGQTSRFPRWAMAYKFPASVASSPIKDIFVEVSRSGRITYVAEIIPVILRGSKISKVTLHNYAFVHNLKLNIGDEVVIKKAGDVIPQIVQLIKLNNSDSWQPPTNCPSCASSLKWNATNIYQVCENDDCPQKTVNHLTHFASKTGLDIKGVSQKNIQKFYENNLLNRPIDFYQLHQKEEELLKLEGFKKKSVANILNSIEESKKRPFSRLLTALGIPLLSSVKAQKLTNFYPNLSSFLTAVKNEEWEKFKEILGEETQKELKKYFQNPKNKDLMEELSKFFS